MKSEEKFPSIRAVIMQLNHTATRKRYIYGSKTVWASYAKCMADFSLLLINNGRFYTRDAYNASGRIMRLLYCSSSIKTGRTIRRTIRQTTTIFFSGFLRHGFRIARLFVCVPSLYTQTHNTSRRTIVDSASVQTKN